MGTELSPKGHCSPNFQIIVKSFLADVTLWRIQRSCVRCQIFAVSAVRYTVLFVYFCIGYKVHVLLLGTCT